MTSGPATAEIIRSAVAAVQKTADALGDAGDEEAALVLDECACRARRVFKARFGPPRTDAILRAGIRAMQTAAGTLTDSGDPEEAAAFISGMVRLSELLEARTDRWRLPPDPADEAMRDAIRREKKRQDGARWRLTHIRKNAKCREQGTGNREQKRTRREGKNHTIK